MKICLINNLYYPFTRGGAEQVVENIAKGLKNAGHEVLILSSRPFGKKGKINGMADNIKIKRLFPWNLFWVGNISRYPIPVRLAWHFLDVFNIASFIKVRNILKKEKPDLVITHNLKGIGYLTPLAIKSLGIKYFHTIHDVQLSLPSGLLIKGRENSWENNFFLVKIYEIINKILFSVPRVVISPSGWLINFYTGKGFFKRAKKAVLPNPVSLINDSSIKTKKPNSTLNFLYVGQVEEHKGVLFLIDSFKEIKGDYSLTVVGDGSKLKEAEKIAGSNERIRFLGRLKNKEVAEKYKDSDLTIIPSLCYENSPTVIYESLGMGVPVLAAEIGGVGELIDEGVSGHKFVAGNKENLIEKINYCLKNKEKIFKMREAAINSVRKYDVKDYIEKIIELAR